MTQPTEVQLYEHPLSPYAQKVKLALREKSIAFSCVQLGAMTPAERNQFLELNPRGEVPVLVHGAHCLYDSSIILAYIEEQWPASPLLPAAPEHRARVRLLEEVMDTHFEANTWGLSEVKHFRRASGALADQLNQYGAEQIIRWYGWLNEQLGTDQWFNGENFGWGDLCVVPFVNGATRFDLFPNQDSALHAWLLRANARATVNRGKEEATAAELDADLMTAAIANGFKREYRDHRAEWMLQAGGITIIEAGIKAENVRFNPAFAN